MDDFERELKTISLDEASKHLEECEKCFLDLENSSDNPEVLETIFRLAHNLKGTAASVGFAHVAEFAHEFEALLLKIKAKEIAINDESVSLLLECNDHLRLVIGVLRNDLEAKIDQTEILEKIKRHSQMPKKQPPTSEEKNASPSSEIPVATALSAEKMEEEENLPAPDRRPPAPSPKVTTPSKHEETIRVSLGRLEKLNNCVGELVILQAILNQHGQNIASVEILKTIAQLNKTTREIQNISMACRMIPLTQTFQKLKRIARDTSIVLGKLVDVEITGEETEVDKTVIEHLSDPLMHIIRNAVDHGLEFANARVSAGKPERGVIRMRAYHQGSFLIFEIEDDGAGINEEIVRNKAIEKGLISPGAQLSSFDIRQLIFHPGFSTKSEASEISGRGVGLDVAKKNIERLSGEIGLESQQGKGTRFRVQFPLTLAVMDGMVVRVGNERFIVPLSQIFETVRPENSQITIVTGKGEALNLREETIPMFHLHDLLHLKGDRSAARTSLALIVRDQKNSFAVVVDEVVRQQQVVMKQVGYEVRNRQGLMGSAILGDGLPAIVLDLQDIMKSLSRKFKKVGENYNERVAS
jgi:two-component system chemotaxis sensor kinase CheA